MSIPKCKECNYHAYDQKEICMRDKTDPEYIEYPGNHWCNYENLTKTDNEGYLIGEKKFIYVKEFKTSPKWCPKRNDLIKGCENYE